jgi:chaperone modulatory protein CbpM
MIKRRYPIKEACLRAGTDQSFIIHCVQAHWVIPIEPEMSEFDDEDIARLKLIQDLQRDLGANDEAIPIILHLLDQLYSLRERIKNAA